MPQKRVQQEQGRSPQGGSPQMAMSSSTPTLGAAGLAALRPSSSASGLSTCSDDRVRLLSNRNSKTPKVRYNGRPMTMQHEYGWRSTIEKFGVSHHGIKRDPNLWPEV